MTPKLYEIYKCTLLQELVPAMGCTEPIAIAYAAALARKALGILPEKIKIKASANIIKNVGRVARIGMAGTDREIIKIMIG